MVKQAAGTSRQKTAPPTASPWATTTAARFRLTSLPVKDANRLLTPFARVERLGPDSAVATPPPQAKKTAGCAPPSSRELSTLRYISEVR